MPSLEQRIQIAHGEKLGGPSFQAHLKEHSICKLIAPALLSAVAEMLSVALGAAQGVCVIQGAQNRFFCSGRLWMQKCHPHIRSLALT